MSNPLRHLLVTGGLLVLLSACASAPTTLAPTVTVQPSTDLKDVATSARRLANQYGKGRVLVAFDLDNTLLTMRTAVGSDHWYDWQRDLSKADPCNADLVPDRLAAQGALYHAGAMRPTQIDASALVAQLQTDGFTTMVVTARGSDFRLPTFRELRRNALSFRDHSIGPLGGFSSPYTPPGTARAVRFEDGVYMLAGQHKGDMLIALYRKLGQPLPAAVVFADDKQGNANNMRDALDKAGIRAEIFVYQTSSTDPFSSAQAATEWAKLQPALQTIEQVMGPVNFDLPEVEKAETACEP